MGKKRLLWFFMALVALSVACSSLGASPDDQTPEATENPSANPPIQDPPSLSLASEFYELVYAGEDLTHPISDFFETIGIPVIQASDESTYRQMIERGEPLVFDFQIDVLSQAFSNGLMIVVDSFIQDLADHGYTAADPEGDLSSEYLYTKLESLPDLQALHDEDPALALVLALGQERARRDGRGEADPIWGDGMLDPLQFTLLSNLLSSSVQVEDPSVELGGIPRTWSFPSMATGSLLLRPLRMSAEGSAPSHEGALAPSTDFVSKLLKRWLKRFAELPRSPWDVYDFTVCASVHLFSHRAKLTLAPDEINRRDPESENVYQSEAMFELSFHFEPNNPAALIALQDAGCNNLPDNGPREGREVTWKIVDSPFISGSLNSHGALVSTEDNTGHSGVAYATFEAFDEEFPKDLWGSRRQEGGFIEARAHNLMPGHGALRAAVEGASTSESLGRWRDLAKLMVSFHPAEAIVEMRIEGESVKWFWEDGIFTVLEDGSLDGEGTGRIEGQTNCVITGTDGSYEGPPGTITGGYSFTVNGRINTEGEAPKFEFDIKGSGATVAVSFEDPKCGDLLWGIAKGFIITIAEAGSQIVPAGKIVVGAYDGATEAYDIPDIGTLIVSVKSTSGE